MKTLKEALTNLVAAAEKCGNQELVQAINDAKEALKETAVVVIACKDGEVKDVYSNNEITVAVSTETMLTINEAKPIEEWDRRAEAVLDVVFKGLGELLTVKK